MTACETCHGKIEEQGAHGAHLGRGSLGLDFGCAACHVVPHDYLSFGHIFMADGAVDPPPAEVVFGSEASRAELTPSYDPATKACANVYCHGASLHDSAAGDPAPVWTEPKRELGCARCHGMPPASHQRDRCEECHGGVATSTGTLVDASRHLDGKIDIGDGSGTCQACHHDPTDLGHRAHREAPRRIRGPMPCGDCHRVPEQVDSPGHLDPPPVEVFPEGFGGLAAARGATPEFTAGRCSSVYCHGTASLEWGGDPQLVSCGSCHAIPPRDPNHLPEWTIGECQRCHSSSVDAFGNIIVPQSGPSAHLNGEVDR